jgi:hypothetical protein
MLRSFGVWLPVGQLVGILDVLVASSPPPSPGAKRAFQAAWHLRSGAKRTGAFAVKQQHLDAVVAPAGWSFPYEPASCSAELFQLVQVRHKSEPMSDAEVVLAEIASSWSRYLRRM